MAEEPAGSVRQVQYAGIGVVVGGSVGAIVGVLLGGGAGIALGLSFGGGLGVVVGAALDARRAGKRH